LAVLFAVVRLVITLVLCSGLAALLAWPLLAWLTLALLVIAILTLLLSAMLVLVRHGILQS
jgi:hypothetical protein